MSRSTHFTVHDVERVLGDDDARGLELQRQLLDLGLAEHGEVRHCPAAPPSSDHVRKPNDLIRSFSRFSATGDGCAGALGASASRTTIAHGDLRIAAGADQLDALVARHLVERLLQRLDVDDRLGGHRHEAVLAFARRALADDGGDEAAALREQPVAAARRSSSRATTRSSSSPSAFSTAWPAHRRAGRSAARPCRCRSADPSDRPARPPRSSACRSSPFGAAAGGAAEGGGAPGGRRGWRGVPVPPRAGAGACATFGASPPERCIIIHTPAATATATTPATIARVVVCDLRGATAAARRPRRRHGAPAAGAAARGRARGASARRAWRGRTITVASPGASSVASAEGSGAARMAAESACARTRPRSGSDPPGAWRAPCARRRPSRRARAR